MNRFAVLPASEKIAYFEMAAANRNILPEFVEKDFWVCWTLQQLFSLEDVGGPVNLIALFLIIGPFIRLQSKNENNAGLTPPIAIPYPTVPVPDAVRVQFSTRGEFMPYTLKTTRPLFTVCALIPLRNKELHEVTPPSRMSG